MALKTTVAIKFLLIASLACANAKKMEGCESMDIATCKRAKDCVLCQKSGEGNKLHCLRKDRATAEDDSFMCATDKPASEFKMSFKATEPMADLQSGQKVPELEGRQLFLADADEEAVVLEELLEGVEDEQGEEPEEEEQTHKPKEHTNARADADSGDSDDSDSGDSDDSNSKADFEPTAKTGCPTYRAKEDCSADDNCSWCKIGKKGEMCFDKGTSKFLPPVFDCKLDDDHHKHRKGHKKHKKQGKGTAADDMRDDKGNSGDIPDPKSLTCLTHDTKKECYNDGDCVWCSLLVAGYGRCFGQDEARMLPSAIAKCSTGEQPGTTTTTADEGTKRESNKPETDPKTSGKLSTAEDEIGEDIENDKESGKKVKAAKEGIEEELAEEVEKDIIEEIIEEELGEAAEKKGRKRKEQQDDEEVVETKKTDKSIRKEQQNEEEEEMMTEEESEEGILEEAEERLAATAAKKSTADESVKSISSKRHGVHSRGAQEGDTVEDDTVEDDTVEDDIVEDDRVIKSSRSDDDEEASKEGSVEEKEGSVEEEEEAEEDEDELIEEEEDVEEKFAAEVEEEVAKQALADLRQKAEQEEKEEEEREEKGEDEGDEDEEEGMQITPLGVGNLVGKKAKKLGKDEHKHFLDDGDDIEKLAMHTKNGKKGAFQKGDGNNGSDGDKWENEHVEQGGPKGKNGAHAPRHHRSRHHTRKSGEGSGVQQEDSGVQKEGTGVQKEGTGVQKEDSGVQPEDMLGDGPMGGREMVISPESCSEYKSKSECSQAENCSWCKMGFVKKCLRKGHAQFLPGFLAKCDDAKDGTVEQKATEDASTTSSSDDIGDRGTCTGHVTRSNCTADFSCSWCNIGSYMVTCFGKNEAKTLPPSSVTCSSATEADDIKIEEAVDSTANPCAGLLSQEECASSSQKVTCSWCSFTEGGKVWASQCYQQDAAALLPVSLFSCKGGAADNGAATQPA